MQNCSRFRLLDQVARTGCSVIVPSDQDIHTFRLLQVIIGNPDLKANHNITQIVEVIAEYDKYSRLRELLRTIMAEAAAKVLIFCETKRGCDDITRSLRSDGWPALALHGDKSQKERDWVLAEFKTGKHPLMLATDVAARGLGRLTGHRTHVHCANNLLLLARQHDLCCINCLRCWDAGVGDWARSSGVLRHCWTVPVCEPQLQGFSFLLHRSFSLCTTAARHTAA